MTRGHRRVDAPGTGAAAGQPLGAPEPDVAPPDEPRPTPTRVVGRRASEQAPRESERDRWLREQRPPHWG